MSKIAKLCRALETEIQFPYHTARAIRNGMRCKDPIKRLQVARKALALTPINAWLVDGKIELRHGARSLIVL